LALAAAMPERWSAFVLLGASTSLRWGELLALTRGNVDLDEGIVRVRRSAFEIDRQVVMGPPKSEAASAPLRSQHRSSRRSGCT
jgi:integrase